MANLTFLEGMKELLNSGDPTIRSWPLVESYWAPFLLCGAYVIFVTRIGPDLMKEKKAFNLRLTMIIYNLSVVIAYITCLLTLVYYFLTTDGYRYLCVPSIVVKNHYSYACTTAGWIIYILKYVEFMDTIFFVLRKKDHLITNLHVIHHAVLPIISWIFLRTETSGFQFIPCGINSFVHVIMYTYYGLAAMGPEVQKKLWWKEYLTLLQITQFIIILLFLFVVVPVSGCKTSICGIYLDMFFATLFLALFSNFYVKTYKKKLPLSLVNGSAEIKNGRIKKDS